MPRLPEGADGIARPGNDDDLAARRCLGRVDAVEHDRLEQASPTRHANVRLAPAAEGGAAGAMLSLQQAAGNAAVTSMVTAQREGLDDLFGPSPFGGGDQAQEPGGGDGGGGEAPSGAPPTDATVPPLGGMNDLGPIAKTGTLIADTIIATTYTPGVGNIM